MNIRVVIVDDQPMIRAGIAMLLDSELDIDVVAEAGDGQQALTVTEDRRPDVVLMDVRMPGMDGLQATRLLTRGSPAAPDGLAKVIILTTYHVDEAVYEALRAGASGFVLKDAAPDDLVSAVRAVAAGDAWLHPAVARDLLRDFAARPGSTVPPPVSMQQLTPREREVMALLAHGLSVTETADHLVIAETTVKTHLSRTLMKLGLRDRAQAVTLAYQSGLVRPGDPLPARAGRH